MSPEFWWYVTRASALIAWVLLVVSVTWGILLSTRILKPNDNPSWLLDLHRWLSGLAVSFTALHMFSLWIDSYAPFSAADLFIPFHSTYVQVESLGKWPIVLGVICAYLLIAVQSTSLLMKVLPRKFWKAIHYLSYVVVLLVSFHAGWSGTDVRAWLYRVVAILLIMLTTAALVVRILFPKSARSLAATVEKRRPNQRAEIKRTMYVRSISNPADGIKSLTFADAQVSELPSWVPGSHITLHLPDGMKRQYSLCGDPAERSGYEIAVLRAAESRGGSAFVHEQLVEGSTIEVSGPYNHFELEPAGDYIFIAGGIGITPIKSMIESLPQRRSWRLLYAGRSRASMAFANELAAQYPDRVTIHANDEQGHQPNLDEFIGTSQAPVYVCGPEPLLAALIEKVPAGRLHYERFAAVERDVAGGVAEYEVTLNRVGKSFTVSETENLLEAISKNGGALVSSCG